MRVLALATLATTLSVPHCLAASEKREVQSLATCLPTYSWEDNSNDVSPCDLAAVVVGACQGNNYTLQAINASFYYQEPSTTSANLCRCSWATYNLLSACALCQGFPGSIINWPYYSTNCSHYLSSSYFPSQQTVPQGTLLPWYAATDPTTWNGQRFNLNDAQQIVLQGHTDVTLGATSTPQKKSTHVGAIVGGIIGGLAVLILLGSALFMYRRRRARKPLEPTQFGAGHVRLPSDTSQITTLGNSYQGMNGSFVTPTLTALSPSARAESDSRSYFGTVAHSDVLYSSAPPPRGLGSVSPPLTHSEMRNRQEIVVPFAFNPDPTHASREDRKRIDRAINPVYNAPTPNSRTADASASNDSLASHRRKNPPAYTYNDVMSTASRARTPVTGHTQQDSGDTSFSADSTRSESPMATGPGARNVPGLATGMTQLPSRQVFTPYVEDLDPSSI